VTARRRVAIVGGGIAGTSAAWALAEHHDVILIEAEPQLGAHATGRSAATLSETVGHRAVCALARASRGFLERPPDGFSPHPLTGPRGLLWIGRSDDDLRILDEIEAVAASGIAPTARRVEAVEARRIVPALRPEAVAAGALWEPDARALDVAALLDAYARGARARGAEIRRGEPALGLRSTPAGWAVRTRSTNADVDVVVNAAGAWGDAVARSAGVSPLGLRPLRRTACLVPAPAEVAAWPLVMDAGGRCYFEPESGGLLLSPADEHPSDPVDAAAEEEDVAWALEMLDQTVSLGLRRVRRAWAGLRTFAPDRVPVVGWAADRPGFLWLVGQGGAGIKTAPALAAAAAALVGEREWPEALTDLGVTAAALAPRVVRRGRRR
jgi:D-arginine dehydrogenase